ncbi:SDR family NAD(P)-dependent oxidoreductase [Colwellia sp. M166]|uniref:SDR family NAD(P)-dependent oxidoreductase n=1 Tax=Colwellia sp. M166 TaxID=2583805 RepID=UPI00211F318F|nr:SDR family NAD(P)-dependent oxidoreductase [Colwellia sp. M166]UUO23338.1 SDR family NAD(P)-dependent oxidoreductase [Colwellia sp. M166]|tara:strand:- start:31587 stop:32330 length:744 start_codon:yes stop_codon:yes gene_type:complete
MNAKRTILITGATSGIGESLLHHYLANDYQVIACGRNKEKLKQLADSNADVIPVAFDITDSEQIKAAAAELKQIARIDILMFNAGDCRYIDNAKAFDGELFASVIATNLQSLGYLLEYFLPKVDAGGQVVFISSSATLLPFPRAEAYGASKAGIDYLANSLRIDLKAQDIAVTLVHPGFIKTPLTDKNDFSMPFLLSSQQAASRIYQGVSAKKSYLHFPKRLTLLLKLLALFPDVVWQNIALKSEKK